MIEIENKLVSEDLLSEYFLCDLSSCKGGCCEEGDAGAPLTEEEFAEIDQALPFVEGQLTAEAKQEILRQGKYVRDTDGDWLTPTVGNGICVYGKRDLSGTIVCLFQQAYREGKIAWEKPISCHLFPIKVKQTPTYEIVNYEPRPTLCLAGCQLGKKEKRKVYQFLEVPLLRKYGASFMEALREIDRQYFSHPQK